MGQDPSGFLYSIRDHGIEHEQFFQGCGTAFTHYDQVVTGCGSSAREAGEDALEMFWQNADKRKITVAEMERLEAAVNALPEEEDAHNKCTDVGERSHDECGLNHYVSILWANRKRW